MFKPSSEEGKKDLRVNVKTLAQGCRTNPEAIYLAWFTSSSCVRLCASRDSLVFLCEKSLTAGEKKKKRFLRFSKTFGCQTGKQFVELNPELHI